MMNNKFLWLVLLLPLLFSCQKYNKAPFDDYEKKIRSYSIENNKEITIDSLWQKRDSLSYTRLQNIEFIYIDNVSSLPKWIFNYKKLKSLRTTIKKSNLVDIPNQINKLEHLSNISINNTQIKSLPETLYKLKNIEGLTFEYNNIANISKNIGKLEQIKRVSFMGNPIKHIPIEICKLQKLESLVLANTKITELPKCLENLQNLDWIDISGTLITEFPIEILNAPKLDEIDAKGLKLKNYKEVKAICEKKKITFLYDE